MRLSEDKKVGTGYSQYLFFITAGSYDIMLRMNWSDLQQREFKRLIDQQHIYVDYTGGGQCPASVMNRYHKLLLNTVFGNPHSNNPTSSYTTQLVEQTRQNILHYFQAGDEYDLIFTPNATGALKIFGESYPWAENSVYILARDNHNSVMGIREYAKRAGATIQYWDLTEELRLQDTLEATLQQCREKDIVLAFPAQSNFSGVMHPLAYIKQAQQYGAIVLLDAAAYVPTHRLDLQAIQPDAVCLSFYKILGFPTGIGGLIIRKSLLQRFRKAWFSGGTVRGVSLEGHVLEPNFSSYEDGTINYALIPALQFVLDFIQQLGGIEMIERHVTHLTTLALQQLVQLQEQGKVMIYGPTTMIDRGSTIAFNILDKTGQPIYFEDVERAAFQQNISLRAGCFCNPGAVTHAFHIDGLMMQRLLQTLHTKTRSQAKVPGALRISFGIANVPEEVDRVIAFIRHWQTL